MSCLRTLCVLCVAGFAGCANHCAAQDMKVWKLLNNSRETIVPGSVYVLGPGYRARRLLKLLDGERSALIETIGIRESDPTVIAWSWQGTSSGCCRYYTISAKLFHGELEVTRVKEPVDVFQILNRPFTGMDYNRNAEVKIAAWKSLLEESIGDLSADEMVVMCTDVVLSEGKSISFDRLPRAADTAKRVVRDLEAGSSVTFDVDAGGVTSGDKFECPTTATVVVSARFFPISVRRSVAEVSLATFQLGKPFDVTLREKNHNYVSTSERRMVCRRVRRGRLRWR